MDNLKQINSRETNHKIGYTCMWCSQWGNINATIPYPLFPQEVATRKEALPASRHTIFTAGNLRAKTNPKKCKYAEDSLAEITVLTPPYETLPKLPSAVIRRGFCQLFGGVFYMKSHGPYEYALLWFYRKQC